MVGVRGQAGRTVGLNGAEPQDTDSSGTGGDFGGDNGGDTGGGVILEETRAAIPVAAATSVGVAATSGGWRLRVGGDFGGGGAISRRRRRRFLNRLQADVYSNGEAIMITIRPFFLAPLFLAWSAITGRAQNLNVPIRDDAGMFHAAAHRLAEKRIVEIRLEVRPQLVVRTVASASNRSWFPFLRTPKVNRMLEEQARKYAADSVARGFTSSSGKSSPRSRHRPARRRRRVSRRDAEMLRESGGSLHEKGDAALKALVDQVEEILQQHASRGPAVVVNDIGLGGRLAEVCLWLLLRLLRCTGPIRGQEGSPLRVEETQRPRSPALFATARFPTRRDCGFTINCIRVTLPPRA